MFDAYRNMDAMDAEYYAARLSFIAIIFLVFLLDCVLLVSLPRSVTGTVEEVRVMESSDGAIVEVNLVPNDRNPDGIEVGMEVEMSVKHGGVTEWKEVS